MALLLPLLGLSAVRLGSAFMNCKIVDCATDTRVFWTINAANASITLAMESRSQGWLALGLSSGGSNPMPSAGSSSPSDIMLGWVNSSTGGTGTVSIGDYWVSSYAMPTLDAQQHVRLLLDSASMAADPYPAWPSPAGGYNSSSGLMRLQWMRALNTGDTTQDRAITPGTAQTVIWATNPNAGSVLNAAGTTIAKHLSNTRGSFQLDFGQPSTCPSSYCGGHNHGAGTGTATGKFEMLRSQCFGNGWPSAELGGDRDGGRAQPSAAQIAAAKASAAVDRGACLKSADNVLSVSWSTSHPQLVPALIAAGYAPAGATASSAPAMTSAIVFTVQSSVGGWMGIGFNDAQVMQGADMLVAWVRPRGASGGPAPSFCVGLVECEVHLSDRYSSGHGVPAVDTATLVLLNASLTDDGATVVFARPVGSTTGYWERFSLEPSDVSSGRDHALGGGRSLHMLWAYGAGVGNDATGAMLQHVAAGTSPSRVDFVATADLCKSADASIVSGSIQWKKQGGGFAIHGCIMVAAFWLCMTSAVMAARYRQPLALAERQVGTKPSDGPVVVPDPAVQNSNASGNDSTPARVGCWKKWSASQPWFKIHVIFNTASVLLIVLGLVAVRAALASGPGPYTGVRAWGRHQRLGAATAALAFIQYALGLARPALTSSRRGYWLALHRAVALVTLILSYIAIPLGLQAGRSTLWSPISILITAVHGLCMCLFVLFAEGLLVCCYGRSLKWCSCCGRAERPFASVPSHADEDSAARDDVPIAGDRVAGQSPIPVHEVAPVESKARRSTCCGPCLRVSCTIALPVAFSFLQLAWILLNPGPDLTLRPGSTFTGVLPPVPYPGGRQALCMHMGGYAVPSARDTSYMCRAFAFPPGVPLHALTFEPLIDPEGAPYVHHMILYASSKDYTKVGDASGVVDCTAMPDVDGPLWVWAVGGETMVLPPGVGIRVGGDTIGLAGDVSGGQGYALLQVHYNNPSKTALVRDRSGVLIRVTDSLRPIDGGLVGLGARAGAIRIPASRTYGLEGTCSGEKTRGLPPATTVNPLTSNYVVYGSALHMHTLGRRIWVEQYRGGVRVRDQATGKDALGSDQMYDFGNQRFLPVAADASLLPGDELRVRCVWENSVAAGQAGGNRVAAAGRMVTGGESTENEMCLAFLSMYPKIGKGASAGCEGPPVPFCDSTGAAGLPACNAVV